MKDQKDNNETTMQEMYHWKIMNSMYNTADIDGQITSEDDLAYRNFIETLISIETFVDQVLKSDAPAFKLAITLSEKDETPLDPPVLKRLYLAKHFTVALKFLDHYTPEYLFSPNVELFFKCCIELDLGRECFTTPLDYTSQRGEIPMRQYELFHDLLNLIRVKSREAEFDGKIYSRQYNANRNYRSAVAFLIKLFLRRLLVLRVDLYYLPKHANCVSIEDARKDFAHFLYNVRRNNELSKHLEGYLWKIEFTPLKKIHFHMLILLDSSAVQSEEFWANKYGAYWSEVITKGRGRFYNGNTPENKKKFEVNGLCGIGKIGRIHDNPADDFDLEKRNILLNTIVAYMLKPDQVLLATKLCDSKHRLFGKGIGRNRIRKDRA